MIVAAVCCCHKIKKGRSQDRNRPLTCVELRGFEPLTPSMPWRCATSCATAPRLAASGGCRNGASIQVPGHASHRPGRWRHDRAGHGTAEIMASGGEAVAEYSGAADPGSGKAMVAAALERWRRLDICVANAAIGVGGMFHKQPA